MFGLHGIGGALIATVILLSALGYLGVYKAITIQQATANDPYAIAGNAVPNPKTKADCFANLQEVKMYDDSVAAKARIIDAK